MRKKERSNRRYTNLDNSSKYAPKRKDGRRSRKGNCNDTALRKSLLIGGREIIEMAADGKICALLLRIFLKSNTPLP